MYKRKTHKRRKKEMSTRKRIMGIATALALSVLCVQQSLAAEKPPESVTLDALANLYEPVEFDHSMHVDLTDGDCAKCHHHTTGTAISNKTCIPCHKNSKPYKIVACSKCHPPERFNLEYIKNLEKNIHLYHIDKPGLKGAYHLNCLWCHKENDAPTGCQDCHARTDAGDRFFHAGKYAPEGGRSAHGHGHGHE